MLEDRRAVDIFVIVPEDKILYIQKQAPTSRMEENSNTNI